MVSQSDNGLVSHLMHDEVGNLVSTTKPKGNCTIQEYDLLNRLKSVTEDPAVPLDGNCTLSDGLNLKRQKPEAETGDRSIMLDISPSFR